MFKSKSCAARDSAVKRLKRLARTVENHALKVEGSGKGVAWSNFWKVKRSFLRMQKKFNASRCRVG